MAVTVLTVSDGGRRAGEDTYAEATSIVAFDGHLAVSIGADDSPTTVALYAPGTWTSAHVDEHRAVAAPPGLGLRP